MNELSTMKLTNTISAEDQLLLDLVLAIQALLMSGELEVGKQFFLKCSCSKVILPLIRVQENIKDRQRGLLKTKVARHLREQHGVSRYEIRHVLKGSFVV